MKVQETFQQDRSGQTHTSVITTDFYEAAYYLTVGCILDDVEIIEEMGKERIKMKIKGDLIQSAQSEYFSSQATVVLFEFRRSYQRLIQSVKVAKKKIKQARRLQGQIKQESVEGEGGVL